MYNESMTIGVNGRVAFDRVWTHFRNDSQYRNSLYLMMATGFLSVTGFIFWFLAARMFAAADVGVANTLINASTFLAQFSFLGLDIALVRYLSNPDERAHHKIHTAMTLTAITTLVVSGIYLFFMQSISPEIRTLLTSFAILITILVTMVLSTWNVLVNSVFTAYRINQYVLLVALAFGLIRLPLLYVFSGDGHTGLFLAYAIALLVGVLLSHWFMYRGLGYRFMPRISRSEIKDMAKYSLTSYFSNVSLMVCALLLPGIILACMAPEYVAYYSIPLMLVNMLNIVAISSGQALLAEGVRARHEVKTKFKKALGSTYTLLLPSIILCVIFGNQLLGLFGNKYAEHGYTVLVILCISSILRSTSYLLSVVFRIQDRVKIILVGTMFYTILTLVAGYVILALTRSLEMLSFVVVIAEALIVLFYTYFIRESLRRPKERNS